VLPEDERSPRTEMAQLALVVDSLGALPSMKSKQMLESKSATALPAFVRTRKYLAMNKNLMVPLLDPAGEGCTALWVVTIVHSLFTVFELIVVGQGKLNSSRKVALQTFVNGVVGQLLVFP